MESPKRDPFDVLQARGLLLQMILAIVVVTVLVNYRFPWVRQPGRGPVAMIAIYAAIAIILLVRGRHAELSWRRLFGARPTRESLPLLAVIVPLILITFAAVWLVFVPLSYVAPTLVEQTILAPQSSYEVTTYGQFAALLFVMVVAAPLVEETLFRGILLHRWARRWGTPSGVVLSSAAFAIGHAEWVGHFVIGVAFAMLYLRTRSLWVPILTHAIYNGIFAVPIGVSLWTHEKEPVESLAEFRDGLGLGLLVFAAGLFLLWFYKDLYWPEARASEVLVGPVPYDVPASEASALTTKIS
jgi:uncharacterized protein